MLWRSAFLFWTRGELQLCACHLRCLSWIIGERCTVAEYVLIRVWLTELGHSRDHKDYKRGRWCEADITYYCRLSSVWLQRGSRLCRAIRRYPPKGSSPPEVGMAACTWGAVIWCAVGGPVHWQGLSRGWITLCGGWRAHNQLRDLSKAQHIQLRRLRRAWVNPASHIRVSWRASDSLLWAFATLLEKSFWVSVLHKNDAKLMRFEGTLTQTV